MANGIELLYSRDMRAYYRLLALGKREAVWCLGNSGEYLELVSRLLAPPLRCSLEAADDDDDVGDQQRGRFTAELARRASSSFITLPPELYYCIVDHLSTENVLRLSLTSRYFWAICRRHFRQCFISTLGRWAGEPIICTSSYADDEDLYDSYSESDSEYTSDIDSFCDLFLGSFSDSDEDDRINLLDVKEVKTNEVNGSTSHDIAEGFHMIENIFPSERLLEEFNKWADVQSIPECDRADMARSLMPDYSQFYPRDKVWVLRNHTTREYISVSADAPTQDIETLGFGKLVVRWAMWSLGLWVGCGGPEDVIRRAGGAPRFDITTAEELEKGMKSAGWKDVSVDLL